MDNVGFIAAAYIATFVVLTGYTWSLWQRLANARRNQSAAQGRGP